MTHQGPPARAEHAMIAGICEVTLQTPRLEALARFYCEALGCDEVLREPGRIWLTAGSHARIGIWSPGEKEFGDRGGRHVHFALSCTPGTLSSLASRLRGRGIEHRGPVEHDGGDRSLYIEDPEGNVVELWDFFQRGEGRRDGVSALAADDGA